MTHDVVFTVATVWLAVLLVACALLVLRARSTSSRILALDTLVLMLIGVLVLWSHSEGVSWFLDAALALSVLGFVATLAAGLFHSHGRVFR